MPRTIALIYVAFGAVWIFFTDRLLVWMHLSPELILRLQTGKGWLFVIMRNAWLNEVRHKNCGPKFVDLETGGPTEDQAQENPHVVYLRKLEREQVQHAIESLPDAYREIIVLRDIEGFTYQEIATVLDCPAGTVMSRLGRARGKLRKLLSTWQPKSRIKAI